MKSFTAKTMNKSKNEIREILVHLEQKMIQCFEIMEKFHYSNGKYIDAKVDLDSYNEAWQSWHQKLIFN